jgi:hypothetical protein
MFKDVHLLSAKDETLLGWGNAFLFFDTLLDARDLCVFVATVSLCVLLVESW